MNPRSINTEGPEEERSVNLDADNVSLERDVEEAPHARPFRAWGAAHEAGGGPSLWARFVGWVRSLLARKPKEQGAVDGMMGDAPILISEQVVAQRIVVERTSPTAGDPDAMWDTPVVARPSPDTPPTLEPSDFSEVWNQRKSPLDGIDWKALEEQPAKPGFFARLFSKKKKEDRAFLEDERLESFALSEPADHDFAAAPSAEDFVEQATINPASLDHSAADSANLAALLGSIAPTEAPADEPIESPPAPRPAELGPKHPGFFSGLLKRVSRSQFVPPEAIEPEPAIEAAAEIDLGETVPTPMPAVPPPAPAAAEVDLGETVPTPMPAVPPPPPAPAAAVATPNDLETTQPFTPFRDARDDFADDGAKSAPRVDDEKTDEFDLVPMPVAADSTAETRLVPGFFGRMFGRQAEDSGESPATAVADDKMPFVLAKFRTFYNEVIRDKHQKSDVISGFATAVMGAGGATTESDPEFAAQLLSKRLSEMLELQAAESNWTGGDAAKYYLEAQYAMVALADETFATIDWPGRPAWHKHMLEPKMYGTRGADIEFFKRIDKLLKEAPNDKGARDLARLYLMVIASGYRGKFRVPNVRRPLAEYRRRLYEYSHQNDPLELYARERRVFPQAAAFTLVSRSVGRFTPAQKWIAVVFVLAVLYIGVSHYAWTSVSADLRDVMSRIQSSISQQPSGSTTTAR